MIRLLTISVFVLCLLISFSISAEEPHPGIKRNPFEPQLPIQVKPELPEQEKRGILPKETEEEKYSRRLFELRQKKEQEEKLAKPSLPDLTITGLIWNTDRPQAIINGQVVGIGDQISEVKILNIRKNGIDVDFQGEKLTLQP